MVNEYSGLICVCGHWHTTTCHCGCTCWEQQDTITPESSCRPEPHSNHYEGQYAPKGGYTI